MSRLLRPGGILLTSRGTEESGRKAKVKSAAELTSMLENISNIEVPCLQKGFGDQQRGYYFELSQTADSSSGLVSTNP
jgi:hypothetical protein